MKTFRIGQITIDDVAEYEEETLRIQQSTRNPLRYVESHLNLAGYQSADWIINRFFWPRLFEELSVILKDLYKYSPSSMSVLNGHGSSEEGVYLLLSTGVPIQEWVDNHDGLADILFILSCNGYYEFGEKVAGGEVLKPCNNSFLIYPNSITSVPKLFNGLSRHNLENDVYILPPRR